MEKYLLYVDTKCTLWERALYMVEANSKEDAVKQLASVISTDDEYSEEAGFREQQILYDTSDPITPEDNDGFATKEILDNELTEQWDNVEQFKKQ